MTGRHGLALLLALTAVASDNGAARAQTDGIVPLLRRLEQMVIAGDAAAHETLLAATADRVAAAAFARLEFPGGLTRVVIQERDRQPLVGTLPGNGYRLVVDAFEQAGDRARVATWQLDVKRVGALTADEWRIADEQRVTSVEALYRLSLNPAKQFAVRNLTIVADDLTLTFPDGDAFVAETDQGVAAMVLLGRGGMRFRPGPETERGQVRIFCGAETLEAQADAVYLRMNPAEFEGLLGLKQLAPAAVDPRELRRADAVLREELPKSFALDLGDLSRDGWSLLPTAGDVLAEIRTRRFGTLTYARSSGEPEDISLFDRKHHHNIALYASPRKMAALGPSYNGDVPADIDVLDYDIEVTSTPDRRWIRGRATLALRVQAPRISSITLRLASPLVVESVVSAEYGRLFSLRVSNQSSMVINLPAEVPRGTDLSLTITYAGRLDPQTPDRETAALQQSGLDVDSSQLQAEPSALYSSGSYWYPQPGAPDYATATMRITVPSRLDCVASGDIDEGSPTVIGAGDGATARKTYVFHATQPLRYLSFVVSRFVHAARRRVDYPADSWTATNGRAGVWYRSLELSVDTNPRQAARGRDMAERAADIAAFYQSIVGDVPYPSFTVALVENDLPGGHSPGYFAVVNQMLPTSPLFWRDDPAAFANYPDFFLAHEFAHQWWGQAVGWRNYHEQWLSEGFSQYFAALYAERERGDEAFAGIMRQMRKGALAESDQGPISLGYRLGHIRGDSRILRALVYNKSAVVLHMLRRLVGDDAFFRGIRRFYVASRFQAAGTNDFRAAMQAETDRPLERFFERWIRGARLPRVKFSYRTDGIDVVLHVEQVDEVFDFPLTVTLQYADRPPADVIVPVTDKVVELRVPLAGALRGADISKADGSLAAIDRN